MNEDNDIAIVGIGCMFPGAENLEEFWKVLVNGEDHVQDIPPERFNVEAYYDPDPDHPYKSYVKKAGLLQRYDEWDNRFFGISDREAEQVDPQHHFVLETVHMALEDAGIPKEKIAGTDTGVYIGAMSHDWDSNLRTARQKTTNTTVTGCDSSILSARIAYFYNLLGPAMTLNTACSSSIIAFHTASQALRNGDISMAITGGVNCILDPSIFISLSTARMASPTGKCHTFSENADGYVRGEGCGIVILKTLRDALRDKNKIWGTIFTGLNQDGHTVSPITSPSGKQQEQLLENVFEKYKIQPSNVQYIEAHGKILNLNLKTHTSY
ncbi:phenolphthiocerol/phthiocerol polyketide synthase subunit C-like [Crassostrea angulata]|nr:phenolphthiocerol/phthiocerol polyketide synthase subunit C-like [Crassostrea angulata]